MPCCRGTPPKSSPASDSEAEETEDSYRDTPVVGSGSEEDNDTAQEGEQPDPSASVASTSAVASAPIASVVEPSTSTSQSPKKTGRLVLFKGSEEQDDPEWKIGGKYKVRQKEVTCWSRHSLDGEQNCELKRGDVVLLIALKVHEFTPVGLISPPPPVPPLQPEEGEAPDRPRAGWIALEDHNNPKAGGPLLKTRLKTSWEIGARYAVKTEVTLRERAPMNSDEVCKLQKDEEVLVVELGIDQGALGGGARLRAKVATDTGAVGWMSPETPEGFQLLDPINLLSAQAVDVHRRSLKARKSGRSQDDVVQSGPRFSWQSGLASPWKVGGQYRLLESSELRSASDQKSSSRVCKLNASTIVVIEELGFSDNNQGVVTPMARVKVADGAKEGKEGWLRCTAAKDGHDIVDIRDQLQYQRIQKAMARASGGAGVPAASERSQAEEGAADTRMLLEPCDNSGADLGAETCADGEEQLAETQRKLAEAVRSTRAQVAALEEGNEAEEIAQAGEEEASRCNGSKDKPQDQESPAAPVKKGTTCWSPDATCSRLDLCTRLPDWRARLPDCRERLPDCRERLPDCRESVPDWHEKLSDWRARLPDWRALISRTKASSEASGDATRGAEVQEPSSTGKSAKGKVMKCPARSSEETLKLVARLCYRWCMMLPLK